MRIQDEDEDIMTQGSVYEPTSEDGVVDDDDVGIELDSEEEPSKGGFPTLSPTKRMIFIVIGVLVLVLLIVGTLMLSKGNEKKRGEKLMEQLEESDEDQFKYTSDEIKDLRLNGFTGDEIERMEKDEVPAARTIEEAKEERAEKYEQEMKPYKDSMSDEYKALISNTWLGGADIHYDVSKADTDWYTKTKSVNVDYKKVPAKGLQCFIRLTIKEATDTTQPIYAFMMLDPLRYDQLSETGNIVVSLEYVVTDGGTVITQISEKTVED